MYFRDKKNKINVDPNIYLPFSFGVDENGNYGYYKAGADTVTPFLGSLDYDWYLAEPRTSGGAIHGASVLPLDNEWTTPVVTNAFKDLLFIPLWKFNPETMSRLTLYHSVLGSITMDYKTYIDKTDPYKDTKFAQLLKVLNLDEYFYVTGGKAGSGGYVQGFSFTLDGLKVRAHGIVCVVLSNGFQAFYAI